MSHIAGTIEWLDKALDGLDSAFGALVVAGENTSGSATHAEPGERLRMANDALADVRSDLFQIRVQLNWARGEAKAALESESEAAPVARNAERTLEAPVGQVTGQLDDIHEELMRAAAWCAVDTGEEAKPHVLAALVSLGRLREALGFRASVVHASETGGAHG